MIALIVNFTVQPGSADAAMRLIGIMEQATRMEPGCRTYIGLQSLDNPLAFSFYEQYDDQKALDDHWASAHFAEYVTNGLAPLYASREKALYSVVSEP